MITVNSTYATGITVGQRKDGSRAVLWTDNSISWHSAEDFANMVWLSEVSVLAEGVQS